MLAGDQSKLEAVEDRIGWIVAHKAIFKEAFILSLDGKVLAADSSFQARGYKAGDTFYFSDEDKQMITEHKHSSYSKVYTYDGTSLKTGYGPIYQDHDPSKPIVALMAINFDGSIIQERTQDIIVQPFIIGASILVIAIVAAYLLIRRMISPLTKLSKGVNLVAQGDLTHNPILFNSKDEIGTLARNFNDMTQSLRLLITEVNETSMQVARRPKSSPPVRRKPTGQVNIASMLRSSLPIARIHSCRIWRVNISLYKTCLASSQRLQAMQITR